MLRRRGKGKHSKFYTRANELYNEYIRIFNADSHGNVRCVTCGKIMPWKGGDAQAGHYFHGLDFVQYNMHVQCVRCNHFLSGNLAEYTQFMIKTYGQQRIDELKVLKNLGNKYSQSELEIMIKAFRESIKALKLKKGLS